jgi:hypothetical protein
MTQHADDIDTRWAIHWSSPERGAWAADRFGRTVGEVKRDDRGYVATRGRRTIGRFRSLDAALDAVDRRSLTTADPSSRLWTMLLATVNVGILAAISLVTAVILR